MEAVAKASGSGKPPESKSTFLVSTSLPYKGGIIAPPEIAIISKAEAVLVRLPNPLSVRGHTAGQTNALAIPNAATKNTEVAPLVLMMQSEKTIPKAALIFRALS